MSGAECAGQPAWEMKELTLEMDVDTLSAVLLMGCMGCMHMCPHFLHLGVAVDSDVLFYVLLLPTGLKQCSLCEPGGLSPWLWRGSGRAGPWGKECVHPSLQDADHGCCYVTSQRCHERWLPAKNASLHFG